MDLYVFRQMELYKATLDEEFGTQLEEINKENEKLVSSLEVAMGDLKNEKLSLSEQLEQTMTKLEDTEDSLFDSKQEIKKKEKEHSMAVWRLMTGIMRMRIRFQKGIEEFDEHKVYEIDVARKAIQEKVQDMALVGMKLGQIIAQTEETRQKMSSVLITYRSTDLIQKKTQLQLFQKELERMSLEKESLEDQRDTLEEAVAELELQVQGLEDEIREHNRASTLQHGRINVSHARKKRRLDTELERILELIDQKREQMVDLDHRIDDKAKQRDSKESDMIDIEKQLMQIVLEQQRIVLGILDSTKSTEENAKQISLIGKIPWPPLPEPVIEDAVKLFPLAAYEVKKF